MKRLAVAVLLLSTTGRAEEPCAASFPARLRDARMAIAQQATYAAAYARVMPWFLEHCRFLTAAEIAVRKLDDPNAFVCEAAPGRPAGLTSRFVLEHGAPASIGVFQDRGSEDLACSAADPVSLVLTDLPADADAPIAERQASFSRLADVLCYADARPVCAKLRARVTAMRAPSK